MFMSLEHLLQYRVRAVDGEVGDVSDFYVDDRHWRVRYVVVDTDAWRTGSEVLVRPSRMERPNSRVKILPVMLKAEQVRKSSPVLTDPPVSLQQAIEADELFDIESVEELVGAPEGDARRETGGRLKGDVHLRSFQAVKGYEVQATDGEIGHVGDFIAQTDSWTILYITVHTRHWLPGHAFILAPHWVDVIDWEQGVLQAGVSREQIKSGPRYNPSAPLERQFETELHDYYGRRRYWES